MGGGEGGGGLTIRGSLDQLELEVKGSGDEQGFDEAVQQRVVEFVVNASTVNGLGEQRLQRRPRDLHRVDVGTASSNLPVR